MGPSLTVACKRIFGTRPFGTVMLIAVRSPSGAGASARPGGLPARGGALSVAGARLDDGPGPRPVLREG